MSKQSIVISKSVHEVFDFLVNQLAQTYQVEPSQIKGYFVSRDENYSQRVSEYIENEKLQITTQRNHDYAIIDYDLKPSDEGTLLELSESASSKKLSRKLNYKLFTLPFFNKGLNRQLYQGLVNIKNQIEGVTE